MSDTILVALIGLGGVALGTLFGWILNSRWEMSRERKKYAREDMLQLRICLLKHLEILETGGNSMYYHSWLEVVMAWEKVRMQIGKNSLHKELRSIMGVLPQGEMVMGQFNYLQGNILEAVKIIDQSLL